MCGPNRLLLQGGDAQLRASDNSSCRYLAFDSNTQVTHGQYSGVSMPSLWLEPCNFKDYFLKYLLVVLFDLDEVFVRIVGSHPCLTHVIANLCVVVSPMDRHTECPLKINKKYTIK